MTADMTRRRPATRETSLADLEQLYGRLAECAWCGVRLAEGRMEDDGESYCSLDCLVEARDWEGEQP